MSAVVLAHGHQARDDLLVQLEGEDSNQPSVQSHLHACPMTSASERGVAELVTAHALCAPWPVWNVLAFLCADVC